MARKLKPIDEYIGSKEYLQAKSDSAFKGAEEAYRKGFLNILDDHCESALSDIMRASALEFSAKSHQFLATREVGELRGFNKERKEKTIDFFKDACMLKGERRRNVLAGIPRRRRR